MARCSTRSWAICPLTGTFVVHFLSSLVISLVVCGSAAFTQAQNLQIQKQRRPSLCAGRQNLNICGSCLNPVFTSAVVAGNICAKNFKKRFAAVCSANSVIFHQNLNDFTRAFSFSFSQNISPGEARNEPHFIKCIS